MQEEGAKCLLLFASAGSGLSEIVQDNDGPLYRWHLRSSMRARESEEIKVCSMGRTPGSKPRLNQGDTVR